MMDGTRPRGRIVVTGRGIMSAIGNSVAAFEASLMRAEGGIRRYDALVPGQVAHVGLVEAAAPHPGLAKAAPGGFDQTAELATAAVGQALTEAGLWDEAALLVPGEQVNSRISRPIAREALLSSNPDTSKPPPTRDA